jgi:Spx/MgsR family transcriptional regulator
MSITLYGIANCDTVKKARGWLEGKGIDYTFHDYKKSGIEEGKLRRWIEAQGWERILNTRGTTFRKLDPGVTDNLDADRAVALMHEHTSAIRRPIVEYSDEDGSGGGDGLLIGFDEHAWSTALGGALT